MGIVKIKVALECPHCGSDKGTIVLNTRKNKTANAIKRYKKCFSCSNPYSTYEITTREFNSLNDRLEMHKELLNILCDSHNQIKLLFNKMEILYRDKKEFFKNKKSRNSWKKLV